MMTHNSVFVVVSLVALALAVLAALAAAIRGTDRRATFRALSALLALLLALRGRAAASCAPARFARERCGTGPPLDGGARGRGTASAT